MPRSSSNSSFDFEIKEWLSKIESLYGAKDAHKYKEEEPILREYLKKLKEETQQTRRLCLCKLKSPFEKGGTAIIFKALHANIQDQEIALKFNRPRITGDTRALLENELSILPQLEHSNIIRVLDVGKFDISFKDSSYPLFFIVEPFVHDAITLNDHIKSLSHEKIHDVSSALLDESLKNLILILRQWVDALAYIHKKGFVYLDVKPDNVIVDGEGHLLVIDFGSAQKVDPDDENPVEIYFTERYADPRLKKKIWRSTSPDRVRSAIKRKDLTYDLDYYALGKSMLELLETISKDHPHDFPQRPMFQSLHLLATRLLNGMNKEIFVQLSKYSLGETFRGLKKSDYMTIRYTDLSDVLRDLDKETGKWNPQRVIPELETFPKETMRVVPNINTVLTDRLRSLIEHPLVARLKMVTQLGLISLVYTTASHSRYDHVLGAYTYTASYIKSLYNDSYNCLFRNLVDDTDIKAGLLASILHDLGQYPLAHDMQEVDSTIFDHTGISIDMLSDQTKDKDGKTLRDIIEKDWGVNIERVKRILGAHSGQLRLSGLNVQDFKDDMLSALIDGPIDADKADYIIRDSTCCRIPYGQQLDINRLLGVLTTVRIPEHLQAPHRVTVGVYEKGRASASAFSLARYLLFASVYWHHTSRIIKTMLQYATVMILPTEVFYTSDEGKSKEIREKLMDFVTKLTPPYEELRKGARLSSVRERTDKHDVRAEPPAVVLEAIIESKVSSKMGHVWYPGISDTDWRMLNWLKTLSGSEKSARGVALINLIQERQLYKRAYTIPHTDVNKELLKELGELTWLQKIKICEGLQEIVYETIKDRQPELDTIPLTSMDEVDRVFADNLVILVDVPNPGKYTGSARPLIYYPELERKTYYREIIQPVKAENLTDALESLMRSISPVRVLCHPALRQWVSACIRPKEIRRILNLALEKVQR